MSKAIVAERANVLHTAEAGIGKGADGHALTETG